MKLNSSAEPVTLGTVPPLKNYLIKIIIIGKEILIVKTKSKKLKKQLLLSLNDT